MIVEKEIKKIIHQLSEVQSAQVVLNGFDMTIRLFDHSKKLSLSTPVYFGGNYLPASVRKCISQRPPFHHHIHTFLSVDEPHFEVSLNYEGGLQNMSNENFIELLESFTENAEDWRIILDENDKQDLVHVRVK
jgi:hypothetical protein